MNLPNTLQKHIEQEANRKPYPYKILSSHDLYEAFIEGAQSLWSKLTEMNEDRSNVILEVQEEYATLCDVDTFNKAVKFGLALVRSESEELREDYKIRDSMAYRYSQRLIKANALIDNLELAVKAKEELVTCYRIGKTVPESLWDRLHKANQALDSIAKYRKENGGKE